MNEEARFWFEAWKRAINLGVSPALGVDLNGSPGRKHREAATQVPPPLKQDDKPGVLSKA